ncbi:hypothetical protein BJ508DRAFT_158385 [Ascobolus immersus RN42]|uniref:Uncharacterized protein n=1 Tax=Ascobolus immersus RN42 TaxID=1160509 RepID=A0A3N4IP25_ASCIM|nr:hypothetical protein BJ508DRAFT_158385 [Ascobolus immersus RN42]
MLRYSLLSLLITTLYAGASAQNDTEKISWKPSPNERGTMEILTSCLITLSICVWTSIHLNVVSNPTTARLFLFRFGWMLVGIFAPEVTFWLAYQQWRNARGFLRDLHQFDDENIVSGAEGSSTEENGSAQPTRSSIERIRTKFKAHHMADADLANAFGSNAGNVKTTTSNAARRVVSSPEVLNGHLGTKTTSEERSSTPNSIQDYHAKSFEPFQSPDKPTDTGYSKEQEPVTLNVTKEAFTMKSAFFIIMGGCTIAVPDGYVGHPLTVTTEGFLNLWRSNKGSIGHYSKLVNDAIVEDKSKSDGLAKAIVLLQATWLLIQCVGRVSAGLPSALLEIHTSIHVVCALATYMLWWNKPQGVIFPVALPGYRNVYRNALNRQAHDFLEGLSLHEPWERSIERYWCLGSEKLRDSLAGIDVHAARKRPWWKMFSEAFSGRQTNRSESPATLNSFPQRWSRLRMLIMENSYRKERLNKFGRVFSISFYTWHRTYVIGRPDFSSRNEGAAVFIGELRKSNSHRTFPTDSFEQRSRMHTNLRIAEGTDKEVWQHLLGIVIALTAYGGLHLLAWRQPFPTSKEKLIWLISASCSTFLTIVVAAIFGLGYIVYQIGRTLQDRVRKWLQENAPTRTFLKIRRLPISNISIEIDIRDFLFMLAALGAFSAVLFFMISRVYLVVGSFIALRSMPVDVYKVVPWSNYWPHL